MAARPTTRIPVPADARLVPEALKNRSRRILDRVLRAYPDAKCALRFETPLDLYVATVLSAQCTDERVNLVTEELFRECRRPEDYLSLGQAGLEERIRSTGFFRNKARSILGGCQVILEQFGGELPRTLEELVTIPGCGRKTANVILGNAFDTPGITVDTHVQRLSHRLELTDLRDPVKIEGALQRLFPERRWTQLSHALIFHGRQVCHARSPRCDACVLARYCPFPEREGLLTGPARPARARTKTNAKGSASPPTRKTPAARTKVAAQRAPAARTKTKSAAKRAPAIPTKPKSAAKRATAARTKTKSAARTNQARNDAGRTESNAPPSSSTRRGTTRSDKTRSTARRKTSG